MTSTPSTTLTIAFHPVFAKLDCQQWWYASSRKLLERRKRGGRGLGGDGETLSNIVGLQNRFTLILFKVTKFTCSGLYFRGSQHKFVNRLITIILFCI